MVKTILFPSSYFGIRKVDEDLQAEYDAVQRTGLSENQDYEAYFRALYTCFR